MYAKSNTSKMMCLSSSVLLHSLVNFHLFDVILSSSIFLQNNNNCDSVDQLFIEVSG